MIFQIVLVAFALVACFKTWKQYLARQVSKYWFLVFGIFWLVVATVAIVPQTTDIVAKYVGIGRGADMLVYIGVVALFYWTYRLMLKQQELSAEMTELVRKLAIHNVPTPSNSPLSKGEKSAE